MRIGDVKLVTNKADKFGECPYYQCVWVTQGESTFPLLLTDHELQVAKIRGENNPEDVGELARCSRISKWLGDF